MHLPVELTVRDEAAKPGLFPLVRERSRKLHRFHNGVTACRVVVERPHRSPRDGTGLRVKVGASVPGRHVVVSRENDEVVESAIRQAFDSLERKLRDLAQIRRSETKRHPEHEVQGFVSVLNEDHGFLTTLRSRQVYFHRNSVVGTPFEKVHIGDGVAFREVAGREGPQASSVRVVSRSQGA